MLVLILFCEQITVMVSNKAPCVKFCAHFILFFFSDVGLSRANDTKSVIRIFFVAVDFQNMADNAVHLIIRLILDSDNFVVSISFLEKLLIKFALM